MYLPPPPLFQLLPQEMATLLCIAHHKVDLVWRSSIALCFDLKCPSTFCNTVCPFIPIEHDN